MNIQSLSIAHTAALAALAAFVRRPSLETSAAYVLAWQRLLDAAKTALAESRARSLARP